MNNGKKPRIIAIANQKGGAGKTTTATNLGAGLVQLGKKVLLFDADPQGNATIGVGIDKNSITNTAYSCLLKNVPLDKVIINTFLDGLDIVPSNSDLANAEGELIFKMQRENVMKSVLTDETLQKYDYIIIDCPPSLGNLTVNSLVSADSVLIPVESSEYCMDATGEFMATFSLVQNINPGLEIEGVLLTKVNSRTNAFKRYSSQLREIFQDKVYNVHISLSQKLADSQSFENFGDKMAKPAVVAFPSCKGSIEYVELAKEVLSNGK